MKESYLKVSIIIIFLLLKSSFLLAQVPNPISFNTGVNATLNGTISFGSNDISWTTSSVSINGPYVPAVRGTNQSAWLVSPYNTADWITYPHTCTSEPTDHSCIGPVDEYFKLMFDLPAITCGDSINSPGGYSLTMNYFADNCVNEIFVNGVSQFTNPSPSYFANNFFATTGTTLTITNNWQVGTNTLIVHVMSGIPTSGFLAFITATATTLGGFTVTPTTNPSCFNSTNGTATVNLTGYSGPLTYSWLPSGGSNSTAANLSPGIYTVNIQIPLCDLTQTLQITQTTSFAVNVSTATPRCKGNPVVFHATGGESYSWRPGNLSGSTITLTPAATSVYTLTSKDTSGCVASTVFTVEVSKCLGFEENVLENVNISHTASRTILLTTNSDQEYKIEIFDLSSHLMFYDIAVKSKEFTLEDLNSGVYVLIISSNNSSVKKKFKLIL